MMWSKEKKRQRNILPKTTEITLLHACMLGYTHMYCMYDMARHGTARLACITKFSHQNRGDRMKHAWIKRTKPKRKWKQIKWFDSGTAIVWCSIDVVQQFIGREGVCACVRVDFLAIYINIFQDGKIIKKYRAGEKANEKWLRYEWRRR